MKKIWALLAQLSMNMWHDTIEDRVVFEDDCGNYVVDESEKAGVNTIVLDVADGVIYKSHPEIAVSDAWDSERVKEEVLKCRQKGIALIPKLNFSASHSYWLGEYHKMTSSKIYYQVCKDIINDVYEMFLEPEYIHIGMDEEGYKFSSLSDYVIFRKGEVLMKDLKFLGDTVRETGAKPWIWWDPLFEEKENFEKYIGHDDFVLSPWYYLCFNEEHFTPIKDWSGDERGEEFRQQLRYIEDLPEKAKFREDALPLLNSGYKFIPCASTWWHTGHNTYELVEFFKNGANDDNSLVGFMTAPWQPTIKEFKKEFDDSLKELKEAREKFYK